MTPDEQFVHHMRGMLSLMGSGAVAAGPDLGAPMRKARDIIRDMIDAGDLPAGKKAERWLFVVRRVDVPSLQSALVALDDIAARMKREGRK